MAKGEHTFVVVQDPDDGEFLVFNSIKELTDDAEDVGDGYFLNYAKVWEVAVKDKDARTLRIGGVTVE